MTYGNHTTAIIVFFAMMAVVWTVGLTPFFAWLDQKGRDDDDVHSDDQVSGG